MNATAEHPNLNQSTDIAGHVPLAKVRLFGAHVTRSTRAQ